MYGKEKVREMARSILPSTRRKGAREDLALIKRAARSDIRRRLRSLRYDDYDDRVDDFNFYPQSHGLGCGWGDGDGSIKGAVYERRSGDKLAHFMRWAVERTAHIEEPDARLAKMRSMLPDGIIGDHAISHLVVLDEFDVDPFKYSWRQGLKTNAERKAEALAEREERWEKLGEIIRAHRQKKLNWALKREHKPGHWDHREDKVVRCEFCAAPRVLLGLHDVVDFERAIFGRESYRHREWKEVVERYLEDDFA